MKSVYSRMVGAIPATKGHVANSAINGSTSEVLKSEAEEALGKVPGPALVVIQTFDNDIACDGTDKDSYAVVGGFIKDTLDEITNRSPKTKVLLLSITGRPATFAAAVAHDKNLRSAQTGDGPCDMFNFNGTMNQKHIATLTKLMQGYEAVGKLVCAEVPQCSWDNGRSAAFQDQAKWMAEDGNHFNAAGHAAFAAWIWPTVAKALGVPA